MSRRFSRYQSFVENLELQLSPEIKEYIVFVNDKELIPLYKELELHNCKIRVEQASNDFVFRSGHDTIYNYLESISDTKYILKLFDTDTVEVNKDLFLKELEKDADIYGIDTYMERGEVWEKKYQLYKKGIFKWYGVVHENQHFLIQNPKVENLLGIKVFHRNSIDSESRNLKKTSDGFIILESTKDGSDSDNRNLLYEYFSYIIANENARHDNLNWFKRHYEINKTLIDEYYKRAKEKYNL